MPQPLSLRRRKSLGGPSGLRSNLRAFGRLKCAFLKWKLTLRPRCCCRAFPLLHDLRVLLCGFSSLFAAHGETLRNIPRHRCDRSRIRLGRLFSTCEAFLPIPGNRSTAERQPGVDGPVNRSPRSRRAATVGPADGSSRRCVDPTWFWFSSGSRACADKRRYGKDNGRSSSGYVQRPARFSACFWSGCSGLLVRI